MRDTDDRPQTSDTITHDPRRLPALMLRTEVAALARCCTRTVARAEAAGVLRPVRRGGSGSMRVLYARADVLRWLGLAVGVSA